MILKRLKIDNFRNYKGDEIFWDDNLNLLHGLNAQGKSNLLEAICYLGLASSFRGANEPEMIRWEQPYFYLEADAVSKLNGKLRISAAASRDGKRRWTVNNDNKTRLADIVGVLHAVIFAPEDINMIKSGPDARRRYLNRQMSQLNRDYCRQLIEYNHVLRQRNACLKNWEHSCDEDILSSWTSQLIELGSNITYSRNSIVKRLTPHAQQMHQMLSGGEKLELIYHSAVCGHQEAGSAAEIAEIFSSELKRLSVNEKLRGMTLCGPHRDDLLVSINGHTARDYGSQGQQRTAALTLKLAELELAGDIRGEYPLLLLDDVLSELDMRRREQIVTLVLSRAQTFISSVDDRMPLLQGKYWKIADGHVICSSPVLSGGKE